MDETGVRRISVRCTYSQLTKEGLTDAVSFERLGRRF